VPRDTAGLRLRPTVTAVRILFNRRLPHRDATSRPGCVAWPRPGPPRIVAAPFGPAVVTWASACLGVAALLVLPAVATAETTAAAGRPCQSELESHAIGRALELVVAGQVPLTAVLRVPPGRELLVVATEHGNDLMIGTDTIGRAAGTRADNPVRRSGRQSLIARATDAELRIRLTGKEHDAVRGRVTVAAYELAELPQDGRCGRALRALAAGDENYAAGQDVSMGHVAAGPATARHAYLLAAEHYLRAFGLLEGADDGTLRLAAAHALAATYYQDLQDWARAADWAERAAALADGRHLEYEAARARALLAAAWIELATRSAQPGRSIATPAPAHARFEAARALLGTLERFHRARGESYDAVLQLNNHGVADLYEARYVAAGVTFAAAAREFGALHERPREGLALQNVAMAAWGRGDLVAAVRSFEQALERLTPEPYPKLYLIALTNEAIVSTATGNFDAALRLNARALGYARKIGNRAIESQVLYGLGITYYALGDRESAERYLVESLKGRSAESDARGRVASLRALGTIYGDAGHYAAAIAADEEALALSTTSTGRARMLVRLAADKAASGRIEEALKALAAVLDAPADADPGPRIEALIERGHTFRVAGRPADAIADLRAALALVHQHDSPDQDFRAELELARALRLGGEPQAALAAVDRALARGDELRRQTANPEFRALRQEPLRPAYDLKVGLLAERYRQDAQSGNAAGAARIALAALATAEDGRAQSLADLSASRMTKGQSIRLRPELERRERLYRDLAARRYRLMERESGAGADDLTAAALRSDIAGLRLELDGLNAELARRTGTSDGRERFAPEALPAWLGRRGGDVAVVEYWLGAEEASAWTITRNGVRWTPLGATAAIADAARAFHAALRDVAVTPVQRRRELAGALYARVIAPLGRELPAGRALVVIPDGALQFIPFAALRTGDAPADRYLVEDRDVAVAPAAWWLVAHRPPRAAGAAPARFLLVADPVYAADDERLTSIRAAAGMTTEGTDAADAARFGTLRRLPWTARETAQLAALLPAARVDQLSGASATRARLLALDWSGYRIIHLASHAIVDAGMPQLSALVLGAFDERGVRVEQAVRVADLASMNLNAELVALSACDTALGKQVAGEGAVGLVSTAIARGAGAVLASLWQAPDEMAARLMTDFYQGILIRHASAASALGAAMRSVLAADRDADPAFWSVFQLSVSRLQDESGKSY
jgi:CHAT domain-containing protein/tetratricopeptide (TPR) repeat protein